VVSLVRNNRGENRLGSTLEMTKMRMRMMRIIVIIDYMIDYINIYTN
jgi:hypothetical protein